jgi:hypothetical protein
MAASVDAAPCGRTIDEGEAMRKLIVGLSVVIGLALPPIASGHPSENRNERAFHGGPHCHTNQHSDKAAFPSHRAHERAGNDVFLPAACPP